MTVPDASQAALEEILGRDDPDLLAVYLTGSAARGMATERSDVDVVLVLTESAAASRQTERRADVDEIVTTLGELESPGRLGTDEWYQRWACAWVQVLRDDTGGRLEAALVANATLSGAEQRAVLVDRLDGYVNFAFRALKADVDDRPLERRLDAAESVPWLLDTVFALTGRVRPYNKYLAWELRTHPLDGVLTGSAWSAAAWLPLLEQMLDGDPAALRAGFADVDAESRAWDRAHGVTLLGDTIDGWGESQLGLLRDASGWAGKT